MLAIFPALMRIFSSERIPIAQAFAVPSANWSYATYIFIFADMSAAFSLKNFPYIYREI